MMVNKEKYKPVKRRVFKLAITCAILFLFACNNNAVSGIEVINLPTQSWMDSVKLSSDTFYIKKYQGNDFSDAEYYINKKDTILTQIMRDTAKKIRQILTVQKKVRWLFAEYYENGQLMAKYHLDSFGKFDGPTKFFYPDGRVKSDGVYRNGFRIGKWSDYDKDGHLLSMETYDDNGVILKK